MMNKEGRIGLQVVIVVVSREEVIALTNNCFQNHKRKPFLHVFWRHSSDFAAVFFRFLRRYENCSNQ